MWYNSYVMADVDFNEEGQLAPRTASVRSPSVTDMVIRFGLAKNAQQAQVFLLGSVLLALLAAVAILIFGSPNNRAVPPNPLEQTTIPGPAGKYTGSMQTP